MTTTSTSHKWTSATTDTNSPPDQPGAGTSLPAQRGAGTGSPGQPGDNASTSRHVGAAQGDCGGGEAADDKRQGHGDDTAPAHSQGAYIM